MSSTNEATINIAAQVPGTNTVTINVIAQAVGTNQAPVGTLSQVAPHAAHAHPLETLWTSTHHGVHIIIIIGLAIVAHVVARFVRYVSEVIINKTHEKKNPLNFVTQQAKFVTLSRLIVSTVIFLVYALAIYFVLTLEYPNNSTIRTYLGSAAVIGLALSFGLQGLVQDIVTCITLILSDTMDVGDNVDLMNGVIGRVERIGLRFVKIINFYNQEIFVPNRNIANVSRFPHGGILAYADVQIPANADQQAVVDAIQRVAKGIWTQFGAIILAEPVCGKIHSTPGNWNYLRIQFKIWPGQNAIIENTFVNQMVAIMKKTDPNYANWQIVVTYRAMDTYEPPPPQPPPTTTLMPLQKS